MNLRMKLVVLIAWLAPFQLAAASIDVRSSPYVISIALERGDSAAAAEQRVAFRTIPPLLYLSTTFTCQLRLVSRRSGQVVDSGKIDHRSMFVACRPHSA